MSKSQPTILVTGASGHLGSLVLTHLTQTYGYPAASIIATSRDPNSLAEWAALGVDIRSGNFADPATLPAAFQGADKLLLVSTTSLDNVTRLQEHLNAIEAAANAGVTHLFYTSMPDPENTLITFGPAHFGTEQAIKASGLTWTILRNNWYFENLVGTIPGALGSGSLYTAAGDGKIGYISRSDLARAAAAALTAPSGVDNTTFTLTGAEALDIYTVASTISELARKPITVIQVPIEAVIEGAKSHGLPENLAVTLASFDSATKAGYLAIVTGDYNKLVGSDPKPFATWAAENIGVLDPAPA